MIQLCNLSPADIGLSVARGSRGSHSAERSQRRQQWLLSSPASLPLLPAPLPLRLFPSFIPPRPPFETLVCLASLLRPLSRSFSPPLLLLLLVLLLLQRRRVPLLPFAPRARRPPSGHSHLVLLP